MRFLFSSDLHGNLLQYETLARVAIETSVDCLLIGGDLAFKGSTRPVGFRRARKRRTSFRLNKTIACRVQYFHRFILPHLIRYVDAVQSGQVVITFGNADFYSSFSEHCVSHPRIHILLSAIRSLTPSLSILTYPYVPLTPHRLKDFERLDLEPLDPDSPSPWPSSHYSGYVSYTPDMIESFGLKRLRRVRGRSLNRQLQNEIIPVSIPRNIQSYSIESDFNKLFPFSPSSLLTSSSPSSDIDPDGDVIMNDSHSQPIPPIWLLHGPPSNCLDLTKRNTHAGSVAIRQAIEVLRPCVVLCGHIHEHHALTEEWNERIGERTVVICSTNRPSRKKVGAIVFEVEVGEAEEGGDCSLVSFERIFV